MVKPFLLIITILLEGDFSWLNKKFSTLLFYD